MEAAIQTVVKVYLKSSKGKDSMSGGDFDSLVQKQLGNILSGSDSKAKVKDLRNRLDDNQDGKVTFKEYMKLIGYLANCMSDAHTKRKGEPAQTTNTAAAAPIPDSENAAVAPGLVAAEPAKDGAAAEAAAKPEPVTVATAVAGGVAAVAAAAGAVVAVPEVKVVPPTVEVVAPAVVVEEKKPEEKEEEAAAAPLAEAEEKTEEASS